MKRKGEVIELSDDDDLLEVKPQSVASVKRVKTNPTKTVSTTSRHFPPATDSQPQAQPKGARNTRNALFVPDDEEDDKEEEEHEEVKAYEPIEVDQEDEEEEGLEVKEVIAKKQSPVKRKPAAAPKKQVSKSASSTTPGSFSVHDLLLTIPDAVLPESIPTDKASGFNYHAFKAKQEQLPQQQSAESIEIPEGQPNCLTGLTIVFTGILPNLTREDCEQLAVKYGAKVTKSLSGKTSLVVLGDEAGPAKVKKIKQHKIKAVDQSGFLMLIKGMPAEGGDGVEAEKAREKREQEEAKAKEEAEKLRKEDQKREKQRIQSMQKAKAEGKVVKREVLDSEKLWTVKYAPSKLEEICGNKSSVVKMTQWLSSWQEKFILGKSKDTETRAVLIHGPPGIGKTTAAHLVAKSLGYDVLEKNASDVRSMNLLKGGIGNVLDNTSVVGFFSKENDNSHVNGNKLCIIMDEVDGMSGGDRGGVGALASFARTTHSPLILICNDKSLPKMRPFDRCTLEIPFRRPSAREMKSRLMTIALRERIKLDPNVIDQLVQTTGNDIRQIINLLSTVSMTTKTIDSGNSRDLQKEWQKNIALKPFDITPRLLNGGNYLENTSLPLYKKMELYFDDHMFVPPMIQENYLSTAPMNARGPKAHLQAVSKAADSISSSDLVDAKIHSGEQLWSLMPYHSIMSTILPASYVAGSVNGRINFSGWFGQNSKTGKYRRLLTDIQYKARLRTGTTQEELRLQYVPLLVERLLTPMLKSGVDSIDEIIEILDYYYLTKEDYDTLMEYPIGRASTAAVLKKVPAKVKSAFTRKYNAANHPVMGRSVQSAGAVKAGKGTQKLDMDEKKKKKAGAEDEDVDVEEDVDPEEEAVM